MMTGILLDSETDDLLITGGQFVAGDPVTDIEAIVLQTNRGELKEWPLIGAEIMKLYHGTQDAFWANDAKQMLLACGVEVDEITLSTDGITITVKNA